MPAILLLLLLQGLTCNQNILFSKYKLGHINRSFEGQTHMQDDAN